VDETYRDAGIQLIKMVGASNHENTVIALQTVYLVQEVASNVSCDDGIQIFENEIAWRKFSGFLKDQCNASLWSRKLFLNVMSANIQLVRR
jgi:hypothetical protein